MAVVMRLICSLSMTISISTAYTFVSFCPLNETLWKQHFKGRFCDKPKTHHCLGTTNGKYVEECRIPNGLITERGCPFAKVKNSAVSIVQVHCPDGLDGCPGQDNISLLNSHLVYKYPSCIRYTYDELSTGNIKKRTTMTPLPSTLRKIGTTVDPKAEAYTLTTQIFTTNLNQSVGQRLSEESYSADPDKMQTTDSPSGFSEQNFYILATVIGSAIFNVLCVCCVVLYYQKKKIERDERILASYPPLSSSRVMSQQDVEEEYSLYDEVHDVNHSAEASQLGEINKTPLHGRQNNEYNEIAEISERSDEHTL